MRSWVPPIPAAPASQTPRRNNTIPYNKPGRGVSVAKHSSPAARPPSRLTVRAPGSNGVLILS
jgi:hypothetical protein